MEKPQQSPQFEAKVTESKPEKPLTDKETADIAGGRAGGDDDDLEELQVQR